jgi:hypothetical protein
MFRRLFVGLVLGTVVGVAAAAALVFGLKVTVFDGAGGSFEAYGAALAVGVLAGLITGKPIWASDAKVEAGLKAVFGALLAAGGMFALRRWAPEVSLPGPFGTGAPVAAGDLPASLALLGASLGALFELDNTDDGKKAPATAARARVSPPTAARRVARGSSSPEPEEQNTPPKERGLTERSGRSGRGEESVNSPSFA